MARILVIDDDDQLRAVLVHTLEAAGHAVVQADNGLAGISLLRRDPPDAVLTDLVMPDQDGLGLIMMIRAELPRLPVIAMSGNFAHSTVYLKIARALGAKRVLAKPFAAEALIEALNDALGGRA